jgi:hypothetical protein
VCRMSDGGILLALAGFCWGGLLVGGFIAWYKNRRLRHESTMRESYTRKYLEVARLLHAAYPVMDESGEEGCWFGAAQPHVRFVLRYDHNRANQNPSNETGEVMSGEVIVICGSREGFDRVQVDIEIANLPDDCLVITGGARGVDRLAHAAAERFGLQTEVIRADWDRHGKRAGYLRNVEMLNREPDRVIAFWDGKSKGTQHTITEARRRQIPVEVIAANPNQSHEEK